MGIDEILKLIETVQRTDIQELEVENGDWRVRIARTAGHVVHGPIVQPTYTPVAPIAPQPPLVLPIEADVNLEKSDRYVELASPMVGTFYRSSEPGAPAFVNENDMITPGQTLCIIEAMKLMNEIPSEIHARIVKILVENAQPVEYGQPLFLLEPA
ncbi:MAG: acetyl-CoA carboxylase biotin carboxyl carrier protein [candidate division Zixibacteria bacterium]|nr:acetyl-CoA carboxylase biotin carboxyl carrier protein [candidate division Zixibacteria bacterium]